MTTTTRLVTTDESTTSTPAEIVSTTEVTASSTAAATTVPVEDETDTAAEAALTTPCFRTGPGFVLPDGYIAADVSSGPRCMFITQAEGRADTTVVAGELWTSGSGSSFEDFVAFVENGLAQGQEPDIAALQIMNTGATGRNLPIADRLDIDGPNQATLFVHESDRRDGFTAISGVIDVDTDRESNTEVFLIWAIADEVNAQLILDLIDSMELSVPEAS